jgi:hypothetical protein
MNPINRSEMNQGIRHLTRKDIDTDRWDACVRNDPAGTLYAQSVCLDHLATDWDALVLDDYAAVLPLPWKRKFGIRYICPPRFMGPLGIFGKLPAGMTETAFLAHIPESFRLWDMNLILSASTVPWPHRLRKNHLLPLKDAYEELEVSFRPACRRIIRQCESRGYTVLYDMPAADIIRLATAGGKMKGTRADDRNRLLALYDELSAGNMAFTRGIRDPSDRLLAAAIFFRCHRRIYYMVAWNNETGRKTGASHFLMADLIREYAGSGLILDFEGSDIPGIAFFFENFGAVPEDYFFIRHNRLPWWLRYFKASLL